MDSLNKTFLPTKNHNNRNWFIIDCKGQSLGRLATIITSLLKGKVKTHYHPAVDIGDQIILVNANKIFVNENQKHYLVYNPGRPGHSLKIRKVSDCLPELTIKKAIKGMLSTTEMKSLIRRVKIYNEAEHPHIAQKPIKLNLFKLHSSMQK